MEGLIFGILRYFPIKRNVRSYRVLANKVCGQESPVGPTHDKHV